MSKKAKSSHEKLQDAFAKHFGKNWQKLLTIQVRASELSWFVLLIEKGIQKMKQEYIDASPTKRLDAAGVASLSSFQIDLETMVSKVIQDLKTLEKKG